jgi:Toprim domain-containing protein
MRGDAASLAARLAENAEAVCKEYLTQGRRCGNYWLVGDVHDNPGRSLFVRLQGPTSGRGAAGKWTDAATGEHGDLLDLIALNRRHTNLRDTIEEARAFLNEPSHLLPCSRQPVRRDSREAARRLFTASRPIRGTLAEIYLRSRGITLPSRFSVLRFHPACYYRAHDHAPLEAWPALIAAVTDLSGNVTGVLRTWLARDGSAKAPIASPRRAMGELLGHAVRFGAVQDVLAAGEGLETMLSLKSVLPDLPMVAALSTSHLAALLLPPSLRRLYLAADNDAAGHRAATRLTERARDAQIEAHLLLPRADDWNTDGRALTSRMILQDIAAQLTPADAGHFLFPTDGPAGPQAIEYVSSASES